MRILFALCCGLLSGNLVFAQVGPIPGTQKVRPVFDNADVVCNCLVKSLRIASEQKLERGGKLIVRRHVVASVAANDLFKISPLSAGDLSVEFDEEIPAAASGPAVSLGETALLFLRKNAGSGYSFSDPFLGATPFKAIPPQKRGLGLEKLQSALGEVLKLSVPSDQINALRLLEGMDELAHESLAQAESLSASRDPDLALSAIAVLLKGNSPTALDCLKTFVETYSGNANVPALMSVGAELASFGDLKSLDQIEQLSSSKYLSIKFGAMDAIRRIGSPHSGAVLVQRLSDSNLDVRYEAVKTLAEIFGKDGDYSPPVPMFDRDPELYVHLWTRWWAEEGSR